MRPTGGRSYEADEVISIHASIKDATAATIIYRFKGGISIHASIKDATVLDEEKQHKQAISIHASIKDATMGSRGFYRGHAISIHASIKDATLTSTIFPNSSPYFNPRIHKGCDCTETSKQVSGYVFQSTHP